MVLAYAFYWIIIVNMKHHISLNNVQISIPKTVFLAREVAGCVALAVLLLGGEMRAQNILTNSGFENGSLTNWTTLQSNNYVDSGSPAHSGNYYYKVYGQSTGSTNYTSIYQDLPSAPGDTYSADAWSYSSSSDAINGYDSVWIEVSFRDASKNALADYRSAVVTSNNIASFGGLDTWFDLQVTNQCYFNNPSKAILTPGTVTNTVTSLVAPTGTAYVRYQVVFLQGADNASGSMYFDDLTLDQTSGALPPPLPAPPTYNIVWDDEFNQPDGSSPDPTKWTYDIGGGGYGNSELEYYTSRTNNVRIEGGQLVIEADQESYGGENYTSTRMKTQGLESWTYGRIEASIKIPRGQGIWPAFWMLGANYPSVGWPTCGEIDIMENIGKTSDQGTDHGTIHGPQNPGPDYNYGSGVGGTYTLPRGGVLADGFHTYAVQWTTNQIQFFLDGINFFTATPASLPSNATWVFTNPQFLILNIAVGGQWPGNPDGTTVFPQQMLVDYVRVYQLTAPLAISTTESNGDFILSWPTNIVCHLQTLTNSLASGSWSDLSNTTNPFVIVPDPTQTSVFYRLESP